MKVHTMFVTYGKHDEMESYIASVYATYGKRVLSCQFSSYYRPNLDSLTKRYDLMVVISDDEADGYVD